MGNVTALIGAPPRRHEAGPTDGLIRVQAALSHLRGVDALAGVVARGAQELCRCCGFDRSIVFRLDGSHLVAEAVHFEGDDTWAQEILAYSRRHPAELTHATLETQMIRRRAPGLILDARNDPRAHRDMVEATRTRSYVAAPIMPAGRVIGFVHADRYFAGTEVDAGDRDLLWAFAEGFGYALERTVLAERLRQQREQVRQMSSSAEAIMNELCDAPVELAHSTAAEVPLAHTAAAMFVAPESRIDALLTRREREVAALMAAGLTNSEIADRLVIAPGTVKSHVKRVLRKLRASNRAEAVARYLRAAPPAQVERRRSS